jgi:hypothetical protein
VIAIQKKIVVDEHGDPVEVIVPWAAFCEIAEAFGWDLDEKAKADLREARADLEAKREDAFIPLR